MGTQFNIPDFPFKIEHIIIAPVNKEPLDRMKLFGMSLNGINANEMALKRYGFINDDLSIYVLAVNSSIRYYKPLDDYLSETGQKPVNQFNLIK